MSYELSLFEVDTMPAHSLVPLTLPYAFMLLIHADVNSLIHDDVIS
jgi:hypothetical protein